MSLRRSARGPLVTPVTSAKPSPAASGASSSRLTRHRQASPSVVTPPEVPHPLAKTRPTASEGEDNASSGRRTRSSQESISRPAPRRGTVEEGDAGDEEVTRCICGQQEYPGLPLVADDSHAEALKGQNGPITEDATGWFIQCDRCQVWQHGGCMGILDETQSPEKYFCEVCRKDLHRILTDLNGRKFSRYKHATRRASSPHKVPRLHTEGIRKGRERRSAGTDLEEIGRGRRATLNSRESAYDEAEQLQRAIEASKQDSLPRDGIRRPKRRRSASNSLQPASKRPRTVSDSTSSNGLGTLQDAESEQDASTEVNPRFQVRVSQGRERRVKAEEQPAKELEEDSVQHNGKPTRKSSPAAMHKASRRGGRFAGRKGRPGRHQYGKEQEPDTVDDESSPPRVGSADPEEAGHQANGSHLAPAESNSVGKPSRPRHMNPNRTSMNDMRRRVAGILEFISHTQVDMANTDASRSFSPSKATRRKAERDLQHIDEESFSDLTAVEMMEVLTRRLIRWQDDYGKHGDK